jgi:hypothetical protein
MIELDYTLYHTNILLDDDHYSPSFELADNYTEGYYSKESLEKMR